MEKTQSRRPPASRSRGLFFAVLVLLSAPGTAPAADLVVDVTGLRSDAGDVHVAIYKTPESFPKGDGMLAERVVPAAAGAVRVTFADVAAGRYAIATFHDENANHDFDQGLFGIPLEGFAFSNGATAFLSAPDFAEAAFTVGAAGARIVIPMSY